MNSIGHRSSQSAASSSTSRSTPAPPTYDDTGDAARLAERFPLSDRSLLYETWQTASKIVPLVNQFYWRDWDHMWSVENSNSHVEGFHGVELFCDNQPMQGSGLMKFRDFVQARLDGKKLTAFTPLDVAATLDELAATSLRGADVSPATTNDDLRATFDDIRGMTWLGRYYAVKIRAAVAHATFQATGLTSVSRRSAASHSGGL